MALQKEVSFDSSCKRCIGKPGVQTDVTVKNASTIRNSSIERRREGLRQRNLFFSWAPSMRESFLLSSRAGQVCRGFDVKGLLCTRSLGGPTV